MRLFFLPVPDWPFPDSFEMPQCEYQFFNNVLGDGLHKDKEPGISTVAFDGVEELLWMGTRSGHVSAGNIFKKKLSRDIASGQSPKFDPSSVVPSR